MEDGAGEMETRADDAGNGDHTLRRTPIHPRAAETVAKIESAALIVLASVGRDRFTTSQVAVEAGLGIGTVYIYFKDRVELLDHVWPDRRDSFYISDNAPEQ